LREAGFPAPTAPGEYASKGGRPPLVSVLMIPIGAPGNLETICRDPLVEKWKLEAAIDNFVNASPAKDWSIGKLSKMIVQSALAATCETKPDTSFANHWHLDEKFHLPIGDPRFDAVCSELKKLEALL
jgi:hypothetical protein